MVGILWGNCVKVGMWHPAILLLISIMALGITYTLSSRHLVQKMYFGLSVYVTVFLLGWFTYTVHRQNLYPNHYTHITKLSREPQQLIVSVTERMRSTGAYTKYLGVVDRVGEHPATGKVVLYQYKDSLRQDVTGKQLAVFAALQPILTIHNPHEFDYAAYLKHQQVYGRVYLPKGKFIVLGDNHNALQRAAQSARSRIIDNLKGRGLRGDELAVTAALLLGQRQDISEELYTGYVNAGVIHLLAISGLHIGMLALLLNLLFTPLRNYKHGRWISGFSILIILWGFAYITGLSPSVIRAITMFSFITVALHIRRPQNSLHTLAASAFVLLLFDPDLLFMPGFQLSYLAVAGIVVLQPEFNKLWKAKNVVVRYIRDLITVMISAQLAVLPVSLYYFHQFPLLFFVGNLCIVPFLIFILGYGFLVILLAYIGWVPEFLIVGWHYTIWSVNYVVNSVASVEDVIISKVYFDDVLLYGSYAILLVFIRAYFLKNTKWLITGLVLIVGFQGYLFYTKYCLQTAEELLVFHQNGSHVIGIHSGATLQVFTNDSLPKLNYLLGNYTTATQTRSEQKKPQHIYNYKGKNVLVLDSTYVYSIPDTKIDYVVITGDCFVNPERVLHHLKPKAVIADGDNYKTVIALWEKACKDQCVLFYNTAVKGAFVLDGS